MPQKQTINIFLVEGNPTGLRSLELSNWNGKGYIIPRDRVDVAAFREEMRTQGVYLLIGEGDQGQTELYIGESEDLINRLKDHNRNKDFWNTALCFFTTDKKLNKAHVKYLEELLIKEAGEAGRVHLQNNNQSQQTGLSESEEEATLLFAENIKRILASVGYTFLKKSTEYEEGSGDVYICRGPNAEARALYTTEGIVVREGSLARKEFVPSADRIERLQIKQRELVEEGILRGGK